MLPEACNLIKKETLAQVFSCKFCEISKNTFSYRTPPAAASVLMLIIITNIITLYYYLGFLSLKEMYQGMQYFLTELLQLLQNCYN